MKSKTAQAKNRLFKKGFWKGDRKLPLNFILFYVLVFFLLGEQLTTLPTYLIGAGIDGNGPDKLHILDLPSGDALHRPLFYFLFGAINWAFFRIFAWPIALIIGEILWLSNQFFWIPVDRRPQLFGVSDAISYISKSFVIWGVLALVPYFSYKAIERKWGKKGVRNAILIVLAINLLLFAFFAYQIFYLGNSYYGLIVSR